LSLFSKEVLSFKKSEGKESIINKLLDLADYEAKTEIANVVGMSVYDLVAFHLATKKTKEELLAKCALWKAPNAGDTRPILLGDYLLFLGARIRINGISHDRGSRREAVSALGFIPTQAENDKKVIDQFFS
jgi:hypothetical protein